MKKNTVITVILLVAVVAVGLLAAILFLQRNEARSDLAEWQRRHETMVGVVDGALELKADVPEDCALVWDTTHERTMFDGQLGFGHSVPFVGAVERGGDAPMLRRSWVVGRTNRFDATGFGCEIAEPIREHFSTRTGIRQVEHFHGAEAVAVSIAGWVCQSNPDWVIQHCAALEGGGARAVVTHPLGMLVLILLPDGEADHYVLHQFMYMGVGAEKGWLDGQLAR